MTDDEQLASAIDRGWRDTAAIDAAYARSEPRLCYRVLWIDR